MTPGDQIQLKEKFFHDLSITTLQNPLEILCAY